MDTKLNFGKFDKSDKEVFFALYKEEYAVFVGLKELEIYVILLV